MQAGQPFETVCLEEVSGLVLHATERPATFGMYSCGCGGCRIGLEATGRLIDDTFVCIKYRMARRRVVHWSDYCDACERFERGEPPDPFLAWSTEPGDWVREVFVVRGTGVPECGCPVGECLRLTRDTLGRWPR